MSQLHKTLNSDDCYRALIARDSRFDGVFFVAVKSTRIYCRPVCTVKSPMQRNCTFYPSAAICESNGYRPCLRCRPELAPGHAPVDSRTRLAGQALRLIDDLANSDLANSDLGSLAKVAQLLGVTPRHLRRVFEGELGVSPMQYILTQRLLAAKLMLTDTNMPDTEIALASGFASVRRFNDAFALLLFSIQVDCEKKQGRDGATSLRLMQGLISLPANCLIARLMIGSRCFLICVLVGARS